MNVKSKTPFENWWGESAAHRSPLPGASKKIEVISIPQDEYSDISDKNRFIARERDPEIKKLDEIIEEEERKNGVRRNKNI